MRDHATRLGRHKMESIDEIVGDVALATSQPADIRQMKRRRARQCETAPQHVPTFGVLGQQASSNASR